MKAPEARRIRLLLPPLLLALATIGFGAAAQSDKHEHPDKPGQEVKTATAESPAENSALTLRAALSDSVYSRTAPTQLLFKVDYASTVSAPAGRPPLNIALVLDRSGSMAEDKKFAYTMSAAREVIANLSDQDVVSIVAYNDQALVLSPAGRAVNKEFLYHRLTEIEPEGYTDLSAGLLEGIAQVKSQAADGQVKQVILLTDGKANRGVTNPAALRKMVEQARAKGVGLSTLGCGTDYNEKLLSDLAEAGGGRYTYVRAPEQIPDAFKDELHGLLGVVAQNARFEISVEHGGISKVFGQLGNNAGDSHQINIGDVRAGERGVVLLALKPSDYAAGATVRATAKLTFDDPQSAERVVRVASAQSEFAGAGQQDAENEEVVVYGGLLGALETATGGEEGYDEQSYRQALADFARWYGRARQLALETHNQDLLNHTFLLKHLLDEMAAAQKQGLMHAHGEAQAQLQKEGDYQRYLLLHHREPPPP